MDTFMSYDLFDNQYLFSLPTPQERELLFKKAIEKSKKENNHIVYSTDINTSILAKEIGSVGARYLNKIIESCKKDAFFEYRIDQKKKGKVTINQEKILKKINQFLTEEKAKQPTAGFQR